MMKHKWYKITMYLHGSTKTVSSFPTYSCYLGLPQLAINIHYM